MMLSMFGERVGPADNLHFNELAMPILIFQVIEGLRRGLSRFMGQSRVALLLSNQENGPIFVFDPHGLLSSYKSELKQFYIDSQEWRQHPPFSAGAGSAYNCTGPVLPGLISCGRQSSAVSYQMWFAAAHPALCSDGPIEEWLAKASWILAHELAVGTSLFTSSATHTLESYGRYAISDYLLFQLRKILRGEPGFRPEDILSSIASISTTYEEGKLATGSLVFVSSKTLASLDSIVRFPDGTGPSIKDHKHARKLLTMVERTDRFLISDGQTILGIGSGPVPESAVAARFRHGHGEVSLGQKLICTFLEGEFSGLGRMPQLQELQASISRKLNDPTSGSQLLHGIANLVQVAQDLGHGCTIVVDFGSPMRSIPGQTLEQPLLLSDSVDLVEGMSRIDGALHLDSSGRLHAFACLLDGKAVEGEDRARGARYNSALRFTADCQQSLAVVVSADGPVAILEGGRQINLPPVWAARDSVYMEPPTLDAWLVGK